MQEKAIILTNGLLQSAYAKTAHGLIRGTERYTIVGVIDPPTAGQDAGFLLDGQVRHIPIWDSLEGALAAHPDVQVAIIGVATHGGVLPQELYPVITTCLRRGMTIVNGLHEFLSDKPEFTALAAAHQGTLIDVRKPKRKADLHFWTGDIYKVTTPIIAVMGTDCAVGKRTTARMIRDASRAAGLKAEMVFTGQTGWLQGGKYGFVFDSTLNDFVSGELEHAILSCDREANPDIILLEGQAALRNPSGPCGSEFLVSGQAKHVVLVHPPKRKYFDDEPHWGEIPSVESEIALVAAYGSRVIALALNTRGCSLEEALAFQQEYQERLQIPVVLPVEQGVDSLVPLLKTLRQRD